MQTTGWLFDLYPLGDRMVLWFITAAGQKLRLEDDFPYCLYLGGPQPRLRTWPGPWDRRAGCAGPIRAGAGICGPAGRFRWRPWRSGLRFLPGCGSGWGRSRRRWPAYKCDLDIAAAYLYSRAVALRLV